MLIPWQIYGLSKQLTPRWCVGLKDLLLAKMVRKKDDLLPLKLKPLLNHFKAIPIILQTNSTRLSSNKLSKKKS